MLATTWRLGQIDTRGEDLVLSELRLRDAAGEVDAGATVTSSHTPTAGTLTNLSDCNPATTCSFAAADVRAPGFWIQWVLPVAQEVRTVRSSGATSLRRGALMTATGAFDAVPLAGVGYQDLLPYPYIENLLSLAPVAAWALDEAGATQTDLVGTNDATRTNGSIETTAMYFASTVVFDPEVSGLVRAAANSFDTGSFSLVFDFKSTDVSNAVIVEHGSNNAGWSVQLSPSAAGSLQFLVGGVAAPVRTSAVVSNGVAHRIVCTYSASKGRAIYVDGVYDVFSWLPTGGPVYNTTYIDVGSRNGTFGPANGSALSNVAIFNRELTPAEVHYLQGLPFDLETLGGSSDPFVTSTVPTGMPVTTVGDSVAIYRDFEFGGFGRIAGTVKEDGTPDVPVHRRVRLHREQDGLLVREVWSDSVTGAYSFDYIDQSKTYTVITYDYEHDYRAVIADNITPELMP